MGRRGHRLGKRGRFLNGIWGQVMEGFESQEEDFEIDTLFDWEPVESVENGNDVFTRPGVSEEARSRVLDHWSLWRE